MSFSELYLMYYPKLVRFAKEFVVLEEDAENITQDVFTDLWERRDAIDHIENVNAYLFRLVRNRCLDYLKHKVFEQKYAENVQASFEIELNLKLLSAGQILNINRSYAYSLGFLSPFMSTIKSAQLPKPK